MELDGDHMRKKILAFAIGWGGEIVEKFYTGVTEGLKDTKADVFLFLPFPLWSDSSEHRSGELNILNLPDYSSYDGAIILGNGMDFEGSYDLIVDKCKKAGIPTVSVSKKTEGLYYTYSDNRPGMMELTKHLINDHNVKDIFFVSGNVENEDCLVRQKAIEDAMEECGLSFDKENVFYTQWSPPNASYFIRDYIASGKKLPDAFMCANDTLALAICEELMSRGVNVPGDVCVTGYDGDSYAMSYDPSISTVSQNIEELGVLSARTLIDVLEGKKRPMVQSVASFACPGESCGCMHEGIYEKIRRAAGRAKYEEHISDIYFDGEFLGIEKSARTVEYYEQMKEMLRTFYSGGQYFEKSFAQIMLDTKFKSTVRHVGDVLKESGYSETMDPILVMDDSETYRCDDIPTAKLLARYPQDDKNHMFNIVPLHEDEITFGYAVLQDQLPNIGKNFNLCRYKNKMSSIISRLKDSLVLRVLYNRITELNETDALTGVKSRLLYESLVKNINSSIEEEVPGEFGLIMFDVNNLKEINDKYGHDTGDKYLINNCKSICDFFVHSPVYRIGGDEFVCFLHGDDYRNREELLLKFRENTYKKMHDENILPEECISMASGLAVYEQDKDKKIEDVMKRADALMYQNKMQIKGQVR